MNRYVCNLSPSRHDVFGSIYRYLYEERIVAHIVPCLEHFLLHKLWVAEAERVHFKAGLLKMFVRRVRHETLDDIEPPIERTTLIIEWEGDREGKRPFQDVIILPGKQLNVKWEIFAFPRSITVGENGRHKFISVAAWVEGFTNNLSAGCEFGIG